MNFRFHSIKYELSSAVWAKQTISLVHKSALPTLTQSHRTQASKEKSSIQSRTSSKLWDCVGPSRFGANREVVTGARRSALSV